MLLRSIVIRKWPGSTRNALPGVILLRSLFLLSSRQIRFNSTPTPDRRKEILHEALQNNPQAILNSATLQKNRGAQVKSAIILIFGTIFTTIVCYVAIQLWQVKHEKKGKKTVFVPLWLNMNLISTTQYKFPSTLKYLDNDFYQYISSEIKQKDGEQKFMLEFQEKDVKYKVLEKLTSNRTLRKFFHFPIPIDLEEDCSFKIWIETKCPTVSGVQVALEDGVGFSWTMKPFNISSALESALIQAGLKLDRLERSQANQKVHERASGKVHEVPVFDNDKRVSTFNEDKDYGVSFAGEFIIQKENGELTKGKLKYKGKIDFDHLMINRGVKLVELSIDFPEYNEEGGITRYKVL